MTTQNIDRLDFRLRTTIDLQGTYEPDSGNFRILGAETRQMLVDDAGVLSAADRDALQRELLGTTASDVDAMTDRVAASADTAPTRPEDYTTLGRFTEATDDVAIGEGFKGERVRTIQEQLQTDGYDLGAHGVDGMWGPDTQTAYEAYVADGRPALDLGGPAAEPEAVEDPDAASSDADAEMPEVDTGAAARSFARASDPSGDFDPNGAAETLLGLDNAAMAEVRTELETSGRPIGERLTGMEQSDFFGMFSMAGNDAHYIDFMQRVAAGRRNEGDAAAATPERVDAYERRLVNALPGQNTTSLNTVFAQASNEQLAELDRRFREEGVWNRDGSVLQYEDGLADYVRAMVHGTSNDRGGAHETALLFRLQQARGGAS